MLFSLAPMEGVTGHVFRRVHAGCFGALGRYYTPFLAPPRLGSAFGGRAREELDRANNEGLDVVPQLLTRDADEFVWASELLRDMGYAQVNLNLGCPSNIVVAKGKGSGALRDPEALGAFLSDVCARSALPVSVKTRLGLADPTEYARLLAVFCRLPLAELIVHPRVQKDRYAGPVRPGLYGDTLAAAPFPVAYNGDVFSPADYDVLVGAYPATRHVMLGRGVLANPALPRMLAGGAALTREELADFHGGLYGAYRAEMGDKAVFRMKEWWSYASSCFCEPGRVYRQVREVRTARDYEAAVERVLNEWAMSDESFYRPGEVR